MTKPRRERRAQKPADPARPPARERFFGAGAAIFLVALALRLVHIWQIRRAPFWAVLVGDARGYDDWARQIAAGDWLGHEVFYQAPLYPYFLGVVYTIFGHSLLAVRLCQALLGSLACVLLGLASRRFFKGRSLLGPSFSSGDVVGLVSGLGLALYAPAIFFDGLIQKSTLDVFFVCLSLWILSDLVDRPHYTRGWLWLGLAMGGLSLTRENALALVVVVMIWGVLESKPKAQSLKPIASFLLGLAVVLAPVAIRNAAVGGGFYLTTSQFGSNLYIGNNPRADGTYVSLRPGRGAPEYERIDATEIAQQATGRSLSPSEVSSYWTGRTLEYIRSQPGAWLRLMGRKFLLLWNATEAADTESQETYAEWSAPLAILGWIGHFGVLVPLALVGVWAAWPDRRRLGIVFALGAVYAASVLVFYVFARYRFPLVPFLMIFAARGIVALVEVRLKPDTTDVPAASPRIPTDVPAASPRIPTAVRASSRIPTDVPAASPGIPVVSAFRRTFLPAIVLLAVAIFCNWPVLSAETMRAVTETNLGTALQEDHRYDEAIAHYERAIALSPGYVEAYNNMATALRAKGDVERAVATYERALAVRPGFADAHYNLGNALMELHRNAEAAEHFRIALQATPDSVEVLNNLGIALTADGKMAEAIPVFEQALAQNPASAPAHHNLGSALDAAGRRTEAIQHLRRAMELAPNDASIPYDLATMLLQSGTDVAGAIEALRRTIALDPGMAEAHNNLGAALVRTGKVDEAVAEFQQALKIDPNNADAKANLNAVTGTLRGRR